MIKQLWEELKPLQKELDNHIFTKRGLKQSEIIEKEILALLVELGECANEWRGFKYWSDDTEPVGLISECTSCNNAYVGEIDYCEGCFDEYTVKISTEISNPLLEELIDVMHFTLSIENYYEFEGSGYGAIKQFTVESQFRELFRHISKLEVEKEVRGIPYNLNNLTIIRGHVIGLIEMLGFTTDQIEKAYYEKNKENFRRQAQNY